MFDPRLDPPRPSDDRSIGKKLLALGCGVGLGGVIVALIIVALILLVAGGLCVLYYKAMTPPH